MYKISIVGIRELFEIDYFKALGIFYEHVRTTDNDVMLYKIDKYGNEKVINCGGTNKNGVKVYKDLAGG